MKNIKLKHEEVGAFYDHLVLGREAKNYTFSESFGYEMGSYYNSGTSRGVGQGKGVSINAKHEDS